MARSTGPILAAGAITFGNQVIVNKRPFTLWQPVAVGITAAVFAGAEHLPGAETLVVGFSWLVLVAVLFVPPPGQRAPVENFNKWMHQK